MNGSVAEGGKFDVIIAGGSFAGLALARGLTQALGNDLRVAIVDRASIGDRHPDNRAFAIWAGSKAILDGLGVWKGIEASAEPMTSIEISDSALDDAVRPSRLTYDAVTPEGEPVAYMVPASVLFAALFTSVENSPSISWIGAADASELASDDRGVSIVAAGKTLRASLCVAADGRNSTLRDMAGIKTVGWAYAQSGIVATVRFSEPHNGVAIQHFLPGGPFAILPLKDNRACITWSAARDEADRMAAMDDETFLAELDKRIGGRFGDIALEGPPQVWPLDVRLPRQLIARRFALIGDAAHGVHPIAGQGVNLALRDAAALTEVITDAARLGLDIGNGVHLERYQRWRRFDSTMSASLYDGINRLFSRDGSVLRAGREAALGVIDRLPAVKRLILSEASGMTGELPKLMRGEAV